MENGWFKMHRGWMKDPVFRNNDERIAFIWMVEAACYEPAKISILGNPETLQRGQFSHSIRFMSEAIGVSTQSMRTIIKHFTKWGIINTQTNKGQLVVSICNYIKYQNKTEEGNKQPNKDLTSAQQTPNTNNKNKRNKEYKEERKEEINKEEKKEENNRAPEKYYWNGKIIKVNRTDFFKWLELYPGGNKKDLEEYLDERDEWLATLPPHKTNNWFYSTGKHLQGMGV